MQRYALGIEYIGTSYKGWQKQKKTNLTIQEKIEDSLSKDANESVKTSCSRFSFQIFSKQKDL